MTFGMDGRWRLRAAKLTIPDEIAKPFLLDVGTGTGDLAITLSKLCPGAQVVGIDLTNAMLDLAPNKISKREGVNRVDLVNGDTLDLPFPSGSFNGITSAFVLRNLVDLDKAFAEMLRVAKPSAHIVALDMTRPSRAIWRTIYNLYFDHVIPIIGGLVSGDYDAYRYLPHSLSIFVTADELAGIMRRAGIRNVGYVLLNLGTVAIHFGIK